MQRICHIPHSNCHYCTSAGYCRSIGQDYCDIYDCGIGDGTCNSLVKGLAKCKSNLTCAFDFQKYHPLLDHCSSDFRGRPYYAACVPIGTSIKHPGIERNFPLLFKHLIYF